MTMSATRERRLLQRGYGAHLRGMIPAAFQLYAKVLKDNPRHPFALHHAALAARQLSAHAKLNGLPGRDDEAMRLIAASVAVAPMNAIALHNFAKFKHDRGELEEARHLYTHAISLNAEQGESWTNLGNVWGELGDRKLAEDCWNQALLCPTGSADSRFNLSFLRLARGHYAEGWTEYESRWECAEFIHSYGRGDLGAPWWDGQELDGRLYLHGEQGAGDVLMMSRWIPHVRALVRELIVEVLPPLVEYFADTYPDLRIVARGDDPPEHDAQLPMMSLPARAKLASPADVPPPIPPRSVELRPEPGRIGVCWKGSTAHPNDRVRSMPFPALAPLLELSRFRWQSLQLDDPTYGLMEPLEVKNFLDSARAIARCELVVTVDTSVAHLAGTLGVPTWLLVPFSAEWRWLQDREDSPWYPSMRIWRQERAGDWSGLAAQVAHALGQWPA